MRCKCGKNLKLRTFESECDKCANHMELGYKCEKCGFYIALSKEEMEDQLLAICGNCGGTGYLTVEQIYTRPIGYMYPVCSECGSRKEGEPFPMMPSFSVPLESLSEEERKRWSHHAKCDWCEGKGWFNTPDWSRM